MAALTAFVSMNTDFWQSRPWIDYRKAALDWTHFYSICINRFQWYKWKKKQHVMTCSDYHFHSVMLFRWGSTFKEVISSFQVSFKTFEEIRIKKLEIKDFVLNCSHDLMLMIQTWFWEQWTTGPAAQNDNCPSLPALYALSLDIGHKIKMSIAWGTRSDSAAVSH